MNPLFYPDKNKQHKNSLLASKKLIPKTNATEEISKDIPDAWYYNENQAEDVWKSFEQVESKIEKKSDNVSPFAKIDESAQKIKSLIDNYEMTDQDVIFGLLNILGDTDEMMELDQQTIFMEARYSLQKMIDSHQGNSEAQQHMLDSLKTWFQNIQNNSKEDMSTLPKLTDVNLDTNELGQLLKASHQNSETTVEAATTLHQSIIETLQKQIDLLRKQMVDKDQEIQRLRKSMELVSKGRRKQQSRIQKSQEEHQAMMDKAAKKIVVQDMKINELKSTINQMKDEQQDQIKLPEDDTASFEGIDPAILAERELEFDTKERLLNEKIQQLREENADLLTKSKQDKIALTNMENKLANNENQLKSINNQLISEHKSHLQQVEILKKKNEDLMLRMTQSTNAKNQEQAMQLEFQRQLQKQTEQIKNQYNIQIDQLEKKHRAAMQDLVNGMKSDQSQGVVNTLIKQQEELVDRMKTDYEQRIFELKESNTQKIQISKSSYEQKIKALQKEFEQYKANQDADFKANLENAKLDIDKEKRKAIYDAQVENNKQISEIRQKLMLKIDVLKSKNRKLQNERDSLRSLIAMSDQSENLPDFIKDDDEEEAVDEDISELDPAFVKIQIEQALLKQQEEHDRDLVQQKKAMEQSRELEIKKVKEMLENAYEAKLNAQKDEFLEQLTNVMEKMKEKPEELKEFINQVSDKPVNDESTENVTEPSQAMISFNDYKELYEKNSKLQDENDFLKATLDTMNKSGQNFNGDVIAAMRKTVANEAEQITRLYEENKILKEKLGEQEGKTTTEMTIELNKIRNPKALLCVQFLQYLNPKPTPLELKLSDFISNECSEHKMDLSSENSIVVKEFMKDEPLLNLTDLTNSEINFEKNEEQIMNLQLSSSSLFDLENAPGIEKPHPDNQIKHHHHVLHLARSHEQLQFDRSPGEERPCKLIESQVRAFESLPLIDTDQEDSEIIGSPNKIRRKVSFLVDNSAGIPQDVRSSSSSVQLVKQSSSTSSITDIRKISIKLYLTEPKTLFQIEGNDDKTCISSSVQTDSSLNKVASNGNLNNMTFNIPNNGQNFGMNQLDQSEEKDNNKDEKKPFISLMATKQNQIAFPPKTDDINNEDSDDSINLIPVRTLMHNKSSNEFDLNGKFHPLFHQSDKTISLMKSCEVFSIDPHKQKIELTIEDLPKAYTIHQNNCVDILPVMKTEYLERNDEGDVVARIKVIYQEPPKADLYICPDPTPISRPSAKIMLTTAKMGYLERPSRSDPIMKRIITTVFDSQLFSSGNENNKSNINQRSAQPKQQQSNISLKQSQSAEILPSVAETIDTKGDNKTTINNSFVSSHSMDTFNKPINLKSSLSQEFEIKERVIDLNSIKDKSLFETKVNALKERQHALYDLYTDIEQNYKELVKRHSEVVNALKQANEMAFGAIKTVGTDHPETLIEKLQSQAAYLTNVLMERDNLSNSLNEQQLISDKRMVETVNAKEELAVARNEKEDLKDEVSKLMNMLAVQKISQPVQEKSDNDDKSEASSEVDNKEIMFLKKQIAELSKRANDAEAENRRLTAENESKDILLRRQETNDIIKKAEKHSFDGIRVGPFVLFDTHFEKQLPKKGFSLTPVINAFDEIPMPQNAPTQLAQISTSPIERGRSPLSTDRSSSSPFFQSKPPPIPTGTLTIKKPILPSGSGNNFLSQTTPQAFHSSLKSALPSLKPQNQGTPLKEAGRSHSFDTFEPIKREDKTVVYITRYVTRDKPSLPLQSNSTKSSTPYGSTTATSRSELTQRPLSGQSTGPEQTIYKGMIKTNTSPLTALKNRIEALENILQNKSHQVLNGKDKEHALNQALFRLTTDYGKMEREFNKMNVIIKQYKEKISDSLALIQRLTAENDELRQLLKEARKVSIANEMFSKRTTDQEFAQVEELKRKRLLRSAYQTSSLENDDFLSRQEAAAIRWQRKREIMQERERNRMYNVLRAMRLIDKKDPNALPHNDPIQMLSTAQKNQNETKPKQEKTHEKHNSARDEIVDPMPKTPPSAKISYEEATINAKKGKVPHKLKMGLIADPIKMK